LRAGSARPAREHVLRIPTLVVRQPIAGVSFHLRIFA
jgi:hypothetical protein